MDILMGGSANTTGPFRAPIAPKKPGLDDAFSRSRFLDDNFSIYRDKSGLADLRLAGKTTMRTDIVPFLAKGGVR